MKLNNRTWKQSSCRRAELLVSSILCLSPLASALMAKPSLCFTSFSQSNRVASFPRKPLLLPPQRTGATILQIKHNDAEAEEDDFPSFKSFYEEEEEAWKLARDFYQELEYRRSISLSEDDGEAYYIDEGDSYIVSVKVHRESHFE
mmetsp:Transcript_10702/g.18816  ORF Transcript_10702/g.18816 Transcript_10702/m.18816 type:complete len:146 (-) Transcript_10702:175-612(-)